jgi:L-proline amide hydrolase
MYDQIGCGRSTHLPEKKGDMDFWTMSLFLSELDNLLSHLEIQGNYSLFGQSWGGSIAAEHAILHPKGLKKLIIANSSASGKYFLLYSRLYTNIN